MNILDSRILLKRSTVAGEVPTVPGSSTHTDGTWIPTDIYEGEAFLNVTDARLYTRAGSTIKEIGLQNSLVGTYQYATITLTSAQILALGTTPIILIAAPGAGRAIFVKTVYARLNFNTTAYATVGTIFIKNNGASDVAASFTQQFLSSTVTRFGTATVAYDFAVNSSNTNILENADLRIYTSANPTAGNSTIDVLVEYQILDFNTIF
jgi:hypothetical protein